MLGVERRAPAEGSSAEPFLRIPPFPGARIRGFAAAPGAACDPVRLAALLRALRVGGTFWGTQPQLPDNHVLVRSAAALNVARRFASGRPVVLWDSAAVRAAGADGVTVIDGPCDPWHVLSSASALIGEAPDELSFIASFLGVPAFRLGSADRLASVEDGDHAGLLDRVARTAFENPFTGERMDAIEAAELCGFWRKLIDSNRCIAGGMGFAFWKQDHVAALLWQGSAPFCFLRNADSVEPGATVAVWRTKAPVAAVADLQRKHCALIEVEDGFLRSRGLGADCVPPLSITVDALGAHFDPSHPSELERLLEQGSFDEPLLGRARALRHIIIEAGIGKYECGTAALARPAGARRHILVPGQVEDDRAVQVGGCGLTSNLELLARVRAQAPDAYILYKPHPDVIAGHRRGAIAEAACLRYADEIVGELPIASLLQMVDEVHANTSLAGFEALLRGKTVTTYGVPFYAGWGLTRDLGPVPPRRTAKRTIEELVAATLLLYPRYIDPVTGLPCPAETVVARLSASEVRDPGLIVGVRRLQGRLMRRLRSLVQ